MWDGSHKLIKDTKMNIAGSVFVTVFKGHCGHKINHSLQGTSFLMQKLSVNEKKIYLHYSGNTE
jgi:hypothetical protein